MSKLDEFGTIAVGKRADLILVEENPLEDAANIRKRAGVMLHGLWLQAMIKRLPEHYREAVTLSEIENLTQQEVAERQRVSLSGAKSRVQRGRAMVKDMLLAF